MSVFTPLSREEMQSLLATQQLTLLQFTPASEGIENSNFFVVATGSHGQRQELVLTLLETLKPEETRWFETLLTHLADAGLPVPRPLGALQECRGKPVLLAPRLRGQSPGLPSPIQAQAIGGLLARLHSSAFSEPCPVADERRRLCQLAETCQALPGEWPARAQQLFADWQATQGERILIHGDLFRDNTLFEGDQLTGVLDFYHACFDLPIYDVAVALNDWALDERANPDPVLAEALLAGYRRERPLPNPELLPLAVTVAALRFWLSRLAQTKGTNAHQGRGSKPPAEFAAKTALRWQQLTKREYAG
jgi:homoserine kinase type II